MARQSGNRYIHYDHGSRPQGWANMVLAVWLFVSPWVLNFGLGGAVSQTSGGTLVPAVMISRAAWDAWVMGAVVFLVTLSVMSRLDAWKEALSLIFGAWIFAAPWVLGFTRLTTASWDHWGTGALIFLVSLGSLSSAQTLVEER